VRPNPPRLPAVCKKWTVTPTLPDPDRSALSLSVSWTEPRFFSMHVSDQPPRSTPYFYIPRCIKCRGGPPLSFVRRSHQWYGNRKEAPRLLLSSGAVFHPKDGTFLRVTRVPSVPQHIDGTSLSDSTVNPICLPTPGTFFFRFSSRPTSTLPLDYTHPDRAVVLLLVSRS